LFKYIRGVDLMSIASPVSSFIENNIILLAKNCRIFSTDHVARWFPNHSRPNQKALEYIKPLVKDKILESNDHQGFESKLFRLSKKGREQFGANYHPVPFGNSKVPHWLLITHTYLDMLEIERPMIFLPEQRLNETRFNPDIFAVWLGRAFWIEVQKSPLTSKRWAMKWDRYNEYIQSGAYKTENWQPKTHVVRPRIVAISKQMPETIITGSDYEIDIVENIKELPRRL
jgi:hypothetical protein